MFKEKENLEIALNSLFVGVNTEIVSKFASPKNIIGKREGDIIYQKGDSADYMYLMIEGIVKLKFAEPDGTNIYFNKEKDTFFGETELLAKTARKSSAVADTDCRMFTLNISELKSLCKSDDLIYTNLYNNHTMNISKEEFSDNLKNALNIEPSFENLALTTEKLSFNPEEDELIETTKDENKEYKDSFDNIDIEEKDETTNIEEEIQFENVEDDIDNDNKDNILEDSDKKDFNDEGITINDPDEEMDNNSNLPPVVQENSPVPETQNEDIEEEPLEEIPEEESEPISYEVEDIKELKDSETNIVEQQNFEPSIYYQEILKTIQIIYSKTLLDEVINSIAESCSTLLRTAGAVLYLVDNENEELTSDILAGNSTSYVRIKFSDGLQGIAAKEKRVIIADSPHNDENFNPIIEDLTGIKMKNIVFYPILSKSEEPVAVLELYNTERGEFQSPDIEILNTVRPFILQAIDNARISEIFIQRKKMASIGQITNFLNDDIKLPLLNIKHYSSLLKKKFSSKEVNRVLDLQIEQADSIEEFLKSVAAFSNSQNIIEPANVKLSNALNNVLTLLAEYVESRNTVIYKKFSADAQVKLDQKQFFQACYQIAQHACDAMPADGKIYITTETDDNYIKIKFRDTGTGIPESELESIFKPFLSNGKNNPSGIGLSLAEKIISDHGGYLMVDSNVGEGSTFTISLPIIF